MDALSKTDANAIREPLKWLARLIEFDSVSSHSNTEITRWVADRLEQIGFTVEVTQYLDAKGVTKANLVAQRAPSGGNANASGGLAYFCHSDVVPVDDWMGPGGNPFKAVEDQGRVFGRGACDMKGSLVAMLAAAESVPPIHQTAPLWFVCTADEETGFAGARHIVNHSVAFRDLVAGQPVGIIGEPTSLRVVHAHKGIIGFRITSHGRAAHSSTAHGVNANLAMVPMLQTLAELERLTREDAKYHDPRFDPPTLSWNFGVSDRATAINITPARCEAWLSLRTMPEIDGQDLVDRIRDRASQLGLEFACIEGGAPLWVDADAKCVREMCALAGCSRADTVCYSTDGGQFTELEQLLVCGPGDIEQAHTADEWITLDQLASGIDLYAKAIHRWCC